MNSQWSEERRYPRTCAIKVPWLSPEDVIITVEKWFVAEGDPIEIDQDLMELKIDQEPFILPSPLDGTLQTLLVFPGDLVETGQELAIVILSPPSA
ncbi:MAG TPA: biotin/lipoyl-containing protein [Bacillota bacterium]|nr:biotin/lipoyl-containing protein [Bacillota bacterium]